MQQRPIRITTASPKDRLDDTSRIHFGKIYTVEHNIKAKNYGEVHRESVEALMAQFQAVWHDRNSNTASRSQPAVSYGAASSSTALSNYGASSPYMVSAAHQRGQDIPQGERRGVDDEVEEEDEDGDDAYPELYRAD